MNATQELLIVCYSHAKEEESLSNQRYGEG